jgi:hypothetical protein
MTGLDQEMMQKNISVRTLGGSQKNVMTLSVVLLFVNFLFLLMGGLLYLYADSIGLQVKGDDLFPAVALGSYLSAAIGVIFIIGLISALFPSADGALTALTSSFCIDILGLKRRPDLSEAEQKRMESVYRDHLSQLRESMHTTVNEIRQLETMKNRFMEIATPSVVRDKINRKDENKGGPLIAPRPFSSFIRQPLGIEFDQTLQEFLQTQTAVLDLRANWEKLNLINDGYGHYRI